MATATQSTTLMAQPAKSYPVGVQSSTFSINTGAVTASGATLIQCAKIPVNATVIDLNYLVSSGAATNPSDAGISGSNLAGTAGSASTFVSAGTGGAIVRATKGLPWRVAVSDDATLRFQTLSITVTPSTPTVSLQVDGTVFFTLDE